MFETPNENRIRYLSSKWMDGTITEEEKREYDRWYTSFKDHEVGDLSIEDMDLIKSRILNSLEKEQLGDELQSKATKKIKTSYLVAASVSLFVLISSCIYLILSDFSNQKNQLYSEIKPGKDKAILTFENGLTYDLDSLQANAIVKKSNFTIEKTKNGELKYSLISGYDDRIEEPVVNTVTTPVGGQYTLLLPDGSKVWLNAASSLKFSVPFSEESRDVELTGEAFFEVAKDNESPFSVITNHQKVEVLGTSFNVNAYEDEELSTTTLVEGKVKLSVPDHKDVILHPGEQGTIEKNKNVVVSSVDVQGFVAWKDGEFMFNNESIESLTRKVSRWYDVEFVFEANVQEIPIWGSVSRYEDIQKLLNVIELTGVAHFRIEGRRIYVMK